MTAKSENRYKTGLVLSGGGVRGMAHIGAIQALEEHGIFPDVVSGSSAGAVVGALYCRGYSPDEMKSFFEKTPLLNISRFAFGKPGFIDADTFRKDFIKYFETDNFSGLQKQLFITAVDMLNGEKRVFSEGELIRPLLASSAFPGLFSPVNMNGVLYADGGILDNFPIDPIVGTVNQLVGVYVSPIDIIGPESLRHSISVLERAIRINYSKRSMRKFEACDILIKPGKLANYGLLDVNKLEEIYQIGYQAAREELRRTLRSQV